MHGGHIGSHFEKTVHKDVREVGQILYKKTVPKYENLIFYRGIFLPGGHIGGHFERTN